MKLIHYSASPNFKLNPMSYLQTDNFKPNGFWFSVEDLIEDDIDWNVWCISEEFRLENLAHAYQIKLSRYANILHIRTVSDIDRFHDKFSIEFCGGLATINWKAVKQAYDGIIIAPYQWTRRLHTSCDWYYGWDCSSGCIWNLRAITEIKEIKTQNAITESKS